jgi:FkbM family methyltransferase
LKPSRAFSCYVDDAPVLRAQAFIWVNCLMRVQGISPSAIFVHMPAGASDFRSWLHEQGVQVIDAEHFDSRNKYCNKLQQLSTFVDSEFEQVVFMDCDTAWAGDLELPLGNPVAAKIVDAANPPASVLKAIFHAAELGDPDWHPVSFPEESDRSLTDSNNCNGGLYICSREFLGKLAPRWRHWARWCLDHSDLFGSFAVHADQVGFALAMRELDARATLLDISWNYPVHFARSGLTPNIAPQLLHYHQEMTPHMRLKPTGLDLVDGVIASLNDVIANSLRERIVNSVFWDLRYAIDPELGSGVGSRGEHLEYKRALLAQLLGNSSNDSIVDVGCGDLEVTRKIAASDYTGLDVSDAALRVASQKRPEWKFGRMQAAGPIPPADVVICMDVLIHQPDQGALASLVERLAGAARRRLLVSGYEEPPVFTSEITRYFEPLSQVLRRTGAFADVKVVGRYRDITVFEATKKPDSLPNEFSAPKVVVGSGWWCDLSTHDWALGSPTTRSTGFFDLWYRQVQRCLAPQRIVVTDSASPVKPDIDAYRSLQWVELDGNYGHANDIRTGRINTKYSGFTRSVLNGVMYALCCDADFFVYVEQDCLLVGDDFLGQALGASTAEIFLGSPAVNAKGLGGGLAAPMLQQSLIVVRRAAFERFISEILNSPWTDGEVPPEETMRTRLEPFDLLQVPYGRSRPIDFNRPHFYVQHLDDKELIEVTRRIAHDELGLPDSRDALTADNTGRPAADDSSAPPTPSLGPLAAELDEWRRAGLRANFWWRDDDATANTPASQRLLALAASLETVVGLAVIPSEVEPGLPAALQGTSCVVWQHGWLHKWSLDEQGRQYSHGEFGEGRSLEAMMSDALEGQRAMDRLFEGGWQRVFVPPFHALTSAFKSVIPSLGYLGLSSGKPHKARISTVPEVNADIDIMDWPQRRFHGAEIVVDMIVDQLRARRQEAGSSASTPIGLLTHHLVMDEMAWQFVAYLLSFLRHHPAAELIPADRIFDLFGSASVHVDRPTSLNAPGGPAAQADVTVVITSCGRQDLLERTLDSFLEFNTYPIAEFIVIEDGDGERNTALGRKYSAHPMRWLSTGRRVGQIAAIDRAYAEVWTEYIFHCEDDWEFHAPRFIEKSKTILEKNPSILQVWLRGLADTNRHPVIHFDLSIAGVKHRLLQHHHDAGEWGVWHGLSWNPGLRRLRDYRLLGSFASLDPDAKKETWRVECEAGAFYQQQGFYAAVLADQDGDGYVRHIGGERRVPRDYLPPSATLTRDLAANGITENLVFDLGAHRGEDTAYYLSRGFRVVAVECAPAQVSFLRSRFASELLDGRLTLIERAIAPRAGPLTFYQNNSKSVWGTAEKAWAERNIHLGTDVDEITVEGILAEDLFHEFGIPYYLKVDIEGRDLLALRALEGFPVRPPYLSLEAEEHSMQALREEFAVLRKLGYDDFKLSAQHHVSKQRVPPGSLQGRPVIWSFESGSSGLFGEDLPGPWLEERQALAIYEPVMLIYDLERALKRGVLSGSLDSFLSEFGYQLGWYDTHARHRSWSGRPPRASFGFGADAKTQALQGPRSASSNVRDDEARPVMGALRGFAPFSSVLQECGHHVPGRDEVPDWQVWVNRDTTPDQKRIEERLETLISPSSRMLHIGAGNSSLGARFAPRIAFVLGTTIHEEERLLAESLRLDNYSVVVANKYSGDMDQVSGRYDLIIDNNPASFACCLFHFARMLGTYKDLLSDGGLLLTAQPGMRWVVTNNDPNWALSLNDWKRVGDVVGMPLEDLGGEVYGFRRSVRNH